MAVYVDALINWPRTAKWKHGKACHLIADSIPELHEFAGRLGLRREWFQTSISGIPHYDLTERKRALAVANGAVELPRREFLDKAEALKCQPKLPA